MHHLTADFFTLTRAARAVFAAIGEADSLTNGGRQDGFVSFGNKSALAGLYLDVECHTYGGTVSV